MESLIKEIASATGLEVELVRKNLSTPKDTAHGDLAFPCFLLAKDWKLAPPACAEKLKNTIKLPAEISSANIVGGYLNFFLDRAQHGQQILSEILAKQFAVGKADNLNHNILLEYQSANIAKPFHVGHLRGTVIGFALDKVFRHRGYNLVTINHLGDWGTQFGFVWVGCQIWGRPAQADLEEIVNLYSRASALRKRQDKEELLPEDQGKPNANEMAREYFRKLEANDPEAVEFWQWCYEISIKYLQNICQRIGVQFDLYRGESFYRDMLPQVEATLRSANILEESRGALGVELGKPLGFARVFTEDGRSLYITRDIAAAIHRHEHFQPEKAIYVVGAPQRLHFSQLVGILDRLGHPSAKTITYVPFGHVPGISTRNISQPAADGEKEERIFFKDLLDDAHNRALEVYRSEVSKRPEDVDENIVAESVAIGALFYHYLCRSNVKDFHFSWNDALNFQGDTGPYAQYALARLYSIESNAAKAGITPNLSAKADFVSDPEVYPVIKLLSEFDAVLDHVITEYEPHHLAIYALNLAKSVSGLYKKLRVVGEPDQELAQARLALFVAIKYVLHNSLNLIGVPPLKRM